MIKKGIDLMINSPHGWMHKVLFRDSAMACDVCVLGDGGTKLCVLCKFRSATLEEFLSQRKG